MPPKGSKKQKVTKHEPATQDKLGTLKVTSPEEIVKELLDNEEYGRSYTSELGIELKDGDNAALFMWLCCSIMFSSGLSEALTMRACSKLLEEKLISDPKTTKDAPSDKFVSTLDHIYQRKEQTAKYLHSAASVILDKYEGSLFKLREASGKDQEKIKSNLKEITGLAEVGVSIFFREAQLVWPELRPYMDKRAAECAAQMGLPDDAEKLSELG
ncbi:hypothetical protein WJX73_005082 [Symbiochloris irregularis]|uniref:Uncharacterized protein n=1 Tax=Symbiochloris irregularis TaxID=706552 RepID=A0AAW1PG37_9CHLO